MHGGRKAESVGPTGFIEVAYRDPQYGVVKYHGTGTLLFGNWFLTAAHVVLDNTNDIDKASPLYVNVRLGDVAYANAPVSANSRDLVHYYPTYEADYGGNLRDDLALVKLDPRVADRIPSAKIGQNPNKGDRVYNLGWGARDLDKYGQPTNFPKELHRGDFFVDESSAAILMMKPAIPEWNTTILQGDSGGPLMNKAGELVGVVNHHSKIQGQITPSGISGAIPVSGVYREWIEKVVAYYG